MRTPWSYLAVQLLVTWTVIATIAPGVWISGLPLAVRLILLGALLVAQWTIADRLTGVGGRTKPRD